MDIQAYMACRVSRSTAPLAAGKIQRLRAIRRCAPVGISESFAMLAGQGPKRQDTSRGRRPDALVGRTAVNAGGGAPAHYFNRATLCSLPDYSAAQHRARPAPRPLGGAAVIVSTTSVHARLVASFEAEGLGAVVRSWIARGPNLPISPDRLERVLGRACVAQLAADSGVTYQSALTELTEMLPTLIDQLTPLGGLSHSLIHRKLTALKGPPSE